MNCIEAVNAIWSGVKSEKADAHIRSCEACKRELEEKEYLIGKLSTLDIPMPSKSLVPSQEVIRAAVRKNNRKPWQRISPVAAAAVLVLGTFAGLTFGKDPQGPATPGDHVSQIAPDLSKPAPQPEPPDQVAPEPEQEEETEPAAQDFIVEIAPGLHEAAQGIETYFRSLTPKPTVLSKVRVLNAVPFQGLEPGRFIGNVTIEYELKPGQTSDLYPAGAHTFVYEMQKGSDGMWRVEYNEDNYPRSAAEVADLWMTAQSSQRAVIQYITMAPKMQKDLLPSFEERKWRGALVTEKLDRSNPPISEKDPESEGMIFRVPASNDNNDNLELKVTVQQFVGLWKVTGYEVSMVQDIAYPPTYTKLTLEDVKQKLRIGQPAGDVNRAMGAHLQQYMTSEGYTWRFDYVSDPNYKITMPSTITTQEQAATYVDQQGLLNGKTRLQVYVRMTEKNEVQSYIVAYKSAADKVSLYHQLKDGTSKTEEYKPPTSTSKAP